MTKEISRQDGKMITLTDEQAELICDRCHYPYIIADQADLDAVCEQCPLCEKGDNK